MKKSLFLFLLLTLFTTLTFCQTSNLTLLCVAAHPDDEDGATLAYYSKIMGYNAYTIFYTRGEGGQNEIGAELNDELGKIREQECYNAAAIQGSVPYFLGCLDFGFSKTAKETFKFWGGKDSVLERIVYMIRVIRPDVVISNHDTITTKPNRQHGNHQAVGITVYEAFDKAADPNYYTEQLVNGVTPWQVKKLYFRTDDTTKTNKIFTIDIYQKDASGKTIFETAVDALDQHRTQGMDKLDWKNIPEVARERHYELIRSDKMYPLEGNDLFGGLVPNEKLDVKAELKSFPTYYNYKKVNKEDSLRILETVKFRDGIKIGLVKTYDNTIENVFKAFNVDFDTLSSNDLQVKDLSVYTTIILDIRAYLYRPDLRQNNNKILNYVNDGGNVVCLYNKPTEWNNNNYSPYPIYLTAQRVTEEDALVGYIAYRRNEGPSRLLLDLPNSFRDKDWDGWVQERSIYLPSDDSNLTSNKYYKFLSIEDEGDPVPSTSLLYVNYGKGSYLYCSLALYRQLKIFHEGALKLFMNMISQPK